MRGHGQQRADGHDAGAADPGDHHGLRRARTWRRRGQVFQPLRAKSAAASGLRNVPPRTVTKAGQNPLRQEKSLLQDDWSICRLMPERRRFRLDRHAFRLDGAIAAALADRLVDDDADVGVGQPAALAPAAFLGGAGLFVDDRGRAGDIAQLGLDPGEVVAMIGPHARRQIARAVGRRIFADDNDPDHPFGEQLRRHPADADRSVDGLPPGHRDGVVVEDLVGHVHAGGDRSADREKAGMEVGTVADVLKHMRRFGEGREADPVRALAAHLGRRHGRVGAVEQHQGVAADPREGEAAFRQPGRCVVRAARTEIGHARVAAGRRPVQERGRGHPVIGGLEGRVGEAAVAQQT